MLDVGCWMLDVGCSNRARPDCLDILRAGGCAGGLRDRSEGELGAGAELGRRGSGDCAYGSGGPGPPAGSRPCDRPANPSRSIEPTGGDVGLTQPLVQGEWPGRAVFGGASAWAGLHAERDRRSVCVARRQPGGALGRSGSPTGVRAADPERAAVCTHARR